MVTSEQKEQCVNYVLEVYPKVSYARACRMFDCSRGKLYYHKKMPVKDAPVRDAIQIAIGTSRKGRKKTITLVQRKHPEMGSSRIRRVYERNGFSLMKKLKRRFRQHPKNPAHVPLTGNEEWAIDFMHDTLTNGRQIRSLNIIDPYNRECKGMYIRHNLPAVRVIEILEQVIEKYGKPRFIRTDNGPEFISKAFQLWMHNNHIGWNKIRKGNPQENCFVERFNKTAREDFFDANLLFSLEEAQRMAEEFRYEYNAIRPHESLNNLTPLEYAA